MRLFHVSEESNIEVFHPRKPTRKDLDQTTALVWAINEKCLPNFLTPRNCPRVCYYVGPETSDIDKQTYLTSKTSPHVVVIENAWFQRMKNTQLYLYEFDPQYFTLQDENAGYYTSEHTQIPINQIIIEDLFSELFKYEVELRVVDNLWGIGEEIQKTTMNWSLCRMKFAQLKR
ncbi:DUF6886 family protein [Bacillus niameyensis]|uniref:DUF6886 family protein n=1 Tax=Bacillus niameyensis TaxID=1522308 RepID=UPI000786735A|nr:DUF6886 family protein [Bacillus niameyensis]